MNVKAKNKKVSKSIFFNDDKNKNKNDKKYDETYEFELDDL